MSLSVEELDATVRSFYDGRGEVVCDTIHLLLWRFMIADLLIAKASPAGSQPGT